MVGNGLGSGDSTPQHPYSFITFGGPTDSLTLEGKRAVRAEAAKRSAPQRRETLAERHKTIRWANQPDRSEDDKIAKRQKGKQKPQNDGAVRSMNAAALVGHVLNRGGGAASPIAAFLSREPTGTSLVPYQKTMGESDWQPDLLQLINKSLNSALDELFLNEPNERRYRMRMQGMAPYMVSEPALFQSLCLLTASSGTLYHGDTNKRPFVLWLKQNALRSLAASITTGDPKAAYLAPTMALMAGYEKDFGEFNACMMHIHALRKVIELDETPSEQDSANDQSVPNSMPGYPYTFGGEAMDANMEAACEPSEPRREPAPRDVAEVFSAAYRHDKPMPLGFFFLYDNQLLPPSLIFNVSQLAHIDINEESTLTSLQWIGMAICGCRPWTSEGVAAMQSKQATVQISKYIRIVGLCLVMFFLVATDATRLNRTVNTMALPEGINALLEDTHHLSLDELVGTVYDEVLLWCLAMCYTGSSGKATDTQKLVAKRLMSNLLIDRYSEFESLIRRFVWQPSLEPGLLIFWYDHRPSPEG